MTGTVELFTINGSTVYVGCIMYFVCTIAYIYQTSRENATSWLIVPLSTVRGDKKQSVDECIIQFSRTVLYGMNGEVIYSLNFLSLRK